MKNIELFNDPFYDLPKKNDDLPYLDYISSNLEEYLKRINNFEGEIKDAIEKNRGNLEILCSCILNSMKLYLEGKTFNAYNDLSKGLDKVKDSLLRESYTKVKNRRDIFHIPFERKHLVSTNRYSIPGVPCVYLGNSIHTCWNELRSPKIKYLYAARYEIDLNTINLLDISMTNKQIYTLNKAIFVKDKIYFSKGSSFSLAISFCMHYTSKISICKFQGRIYYSANANAVV